MSIYLQGNPEPKQTNETFSVASV